MHEKMARIARQSSAIGGLLFVLEVSIAGMIEANTQRL